MCQRFQHRQVNQNWLDLAVFCMIILCDVHVINYAGWDTQSGLNTGIMHAINRIPFWLVLENNVIGDISNATNGFLRKHNSLVRFRERKSCSNQAWSVFPHAFVLRLLYVILQIFTVFTKEQFTPPINISYEKIAFQVAHFLKSLTQNIAQCCVLCANKIVPSWKRKTSLREVSPHSGRAKSCGIIKAVWKLVPIFSGVARTLWGKL